MKDLDVDLGERFKNRPAGWIETFGVDSDLRADLTVGLTDFEPDSRIDLTNKPRKGSLRRIHPAMTFGCTFGMNHDWIWMRWTIIDAVIRKTSNTDCALYLFSGGCDGKNIPEVYSSKIWQKLWSLTYCQPTLPFSTLTPPLPHPPRFSLLFVF